MNIGRTAAQIICDDKLQEAQFTRGTIFKPT
jgi:hypothetical protein